MRLVSLLPVMQPVAGKLLIPGFPAGLLGKVRAMLSHSCTTCLILLELFLLPSCLAVKQL